MSEEEKLAALEAWGRAEGEQQAWQEAYLAWFLDLVD